MYKGLFKSFPNGLTCCNLLSGCAAVKSAFEGNPRLAFMLVLAGAAFDFLDGFAARRLKISSAVGKELDSLADVITFGLAPSAMAFDLLCKAAVPESMAGAAQVYPYTAFVMTAFSALRLAKFNLDSRQSSSFIGLPTPANALFWGSAACSANAALLASPASVYAVVFMVFASSALLVCEIPMFALKFKNFTWADNKVRYMFLAASAAFVIVFGIGGFSVSALLYILVSLLTEKR